MKARGIIKKAVVPLATLFFSSVSPVYSQTNPLTKYVEYQKHKSNGQYELALGDLMVLQRSEIWNDNLENELRLINQNILKKSSYSIGILPFKNYTQDQAITGYFQSKLTNSLFESKKGLAKIVEREQLGTLIDEGDGVALKGGKVKPNYVIVGSITLFDIVSEVRSISKSKQFTDPSKKIPNPAYYSTKEEMDKAYALYAIELEKQKNNQTGSLVDIGIGVLTGNENSTNRGLVGLGAGAIVYSPEYYLNQYNELKRKLDSTPAYLDGTSNVDYIQEEHVKEGVLELSYRIIELSTNNIVSAEDIKVEVTKSDTVTPSIPQAGVVGDELNIPTNMDIKKELLEESVRELSDKINCELDKVYLEKAERAADDTEKFKNSIKYMVTTGNSGCGTDRSVTEFVNNFLGINP